MDVVLWAIRLDHRLTEAEAADLAAGLPRFWRERAVARGGLARQEALCAYALLQEALWETAGWPHLPETALTARGKPWFPAHPEVHFSLSHTRGAVLAALAGEPVGVDVEQLRPLRWPRVKARLGTDLTGTEFFQLWVRREARAKRRGAGLGDRGGLYASGGLPRICRRPVCRGSAVSASPPVLGGVAESQPGSPG